MSLPLYLQENHNRIINSPAQQIALWNTSYDRYTEFDVVKKIYQLFPERNIQRNDVIKLLSRNSYIGFIAAMMWGGINANRPSTAGGTNTPFRRILEHPQEKVEEAILYAEKKTKSGEFYELFLSFAPNGIHSLPGIGYAYYTKLFFFLGQLHDVPLKPLILDKWTSNAHCALTVQTTQNQDLTYLGISNNFPYSVKLPTSSIAKAHLYSQFISDFDNWTQKLNEINEQKISSAKVEEFVFGQSLKLISHSSNPRKELWEIIVSHFGRVGDNTEMKISRKNKQRGTLQNCAVEEIEEGKKYYHLQEHFRKCSNQMTETLVLSISTIETVLSQDRENLLPNWAFTRAPGFWGNSGHKEHVQKVAWLSQGYRVSNYQVNLENRSGSIKFVKINDHESLKS